MDTVVNLIHLIAAVTWIGGMIFMHFIFMPALGVVEAPHRPGLLGVAAKRFTITAWLSTVALAVTGLLRTPRSILLDTTSTYGLLLTIKLLAFAVMIVIGAVITFRIALRLRRFAPGPGEPPPEQFLAAQQAVKRLSGANMILGGVILLLVTMLRV